MRKTNIIIKNKEHTDLMTQENLTDKKSGEDLI